MHDATLIRHAYVLTCCQTRGIHGALLATLVVLHEAVTVHQCRYQVETVTLVKTDGPLGGGHVPTNNWPLDRPEQRDMLHLPGGKAQGAKFD